MTVPPNAVPPARMIVVTPPLTFGSPSEGAGAQFGGRAAEEVDRQMARIDLDEFENASARLTVTPALPGRRSQRCRPN